MIAMFDVIMFLVIVVAIIYKEAKVSTAPTRL